MAGCLVQYLCTMDLGNAISVGWLINVLSLTPPPPSPCEASSEGDLSDDEIVHI